MPSSIDQLGPLPPEQQRIWDKCYHPSGTFMPFPKEAIEQSIPERFEEMVRLYPERLAVKTPQEGYTYAALHERVHQVAHTILERCGAGQEPVALLFELGVSVITATLGVMTAGKICVNLDASQPPVRLGHTLDDTQARLIITNHRNLSRARAAKGCDVLNVDELEGALPAQSPSVSISPDMLASILYTSGSTTQSKGVMQSHRSLLHLVMRLTNTLRICADDRSLLVSPVSHIMGLMDSLRALLNGGVLVPFDLHEHGIAEVANQLIQQDITIYHSATTVFRSFIESLHGVVTFPTLRVIHLGGEPLFRRDVKLYQQHFFSPCILHTSFGATEASSFRVYFADHETVITDNRVPAGYAVDKDMEVLLLDETGQKVGAHQIGEIAVKSAYLSPGYWRNPELTDATFLPGADGTNERIYFTGDLGYLGADGCLVHTGRKDFEVKIRGKRVDLGEVEQALVDLEMVRTAAVVVHQDRTGGQRLVAYVVLNTSQKPPVAAWVQALSTRLSAHMVPSSFEVLDALPLLHSGKVDRRALPAPHHVRPALEISYVGPQTPVEMTLARIWGEVLNLEQVGIHDPFLALGGHSLLAIQLLARVIEIFQVDLSLRTLIETSTIAEMAVVIAQQQAAASDPDTIIRLLAEVEALADDDVQRHLDNERPT